VIFSDFSPKPLYLLSFYPYPERAETPFGMTGLILEATEEKAGQFERLGLFKLWQRYHDVLVEAFKSKTLRADAYVDFDGKDRYCIELV
jgi:predicted lipase